MTVYLVGAGPGDPGLLTVRAAEVLAGADVVVHDRLAEVSLLDLAPMAAERIDVGKSPGQPVDQDQINQLLIQRARQGLTVVRLKGGDPFVFGRGGEEALALTEAGVAWEMVPGITSAIAAPAYAGVPVTHRGLATSFTVVTGHSRHAVDQETNWRALAAAGGTIVVLMGVAHRGAIAAHLIAGGLAPATPVMAVRWGTRSEQTTVRTTLAALGATPLEPPVTIVVGPVAALDLAWFERRPLFGRRVVVTRARADASGLSEQLRALGAEVIELPTIEVADPADGGAGLTPGRGRPGRGRYRWVVFTSPRAVARFLPYLRDARAFGSSSIAAIGTGTGAALAARSLVADLIPPEFVAESLVAAFPRGSGEVLVPRAAVARDVLPDGLAAKGWTVDVVEAYRTEVAQPDPAALAAAARADAITFTSSSTVTNYVALAEPPTVPPFVACIGPVTAATARTAGLAVDVVADEHSIEGLIAALVSGLRRSTVVLTPMAFPERRMRRLRRTPALRRMVAETKLSVDDLIAPLFVREGIDEPQPIASLPGVVQHTRDSLVKEAERLSFLGVPAVVLFGVPARQGCGRFRGVEPRRDRPGGHRGPEGRARRRAWSSSPTCAWTSTPTTATAASWTTAAGSTTTRPWSCTSGSPWPRQWRGPTSSPRRG